MAKDGEPDRERSSSEARLRGLCESPWLWRLEPWRGPSPGQGAFQRVEALSVGDEPVDMQAYWDLDPCGCGDLRREGRVEHRGSEVVL